MPLTPLFYLNLFAVIVQLTIVASLLFRKNNTLANKLLALIMFYPVLTITFNIVFIILQQHNLIVLSPVNIATLLTMGPVLLTYVRLLQGKATKPTPKFLLHFLPAVLILLSGVYYVTTNEAERKVILQKVLAGEDNYTNFINLLLLFQVFAYLVAAHLEVKKYSKAAKNFYTNMEGPEIKWTRTIVNYIALLNLLLLLSYVIPVLITGRTHIYSDLIATPVSSVLLYLFMVYKGFSYHAIFDKPSYVQLVANTQPLNNFITQAAATPEPEPPVREPEIKGSDHAKERIEGLFTVRKVHTQPGLKLHTMAEMLNMSPALLSKHINSSFGTTFFELVNRHRVEEAKRLLLDPKHQHLKIESIGEMAGFSSRASFFSVFKKYTGLTPLAFKVNRTN